MSRPGPAGCPTLRAILLEALPLDAGRAGEARVWMAFWSAASHPAGVARRCSARAIGSGVSWWPGCSTRPSSAGEVVADVDPTSAGEQLMCLVDGLLMQATLEPQRLPAHRQVLFLDAALRRLAG